MTIKAQPYCEAWEKDRERRKPLGLYKAMNWQRNLVLSICAQEEFLVEDPVQLSLLGILILLKSRNIIQFA